MGRTFKSKLRKFGNSLGVIVPNEVVQEAGAREGDVIEVTIPPSKEKRKDWFVKYGGIDAGAGPFERDEEGRF